MIGNSKKRSRYRNSFAITLRNYQIEFSAKHFTVLCILLSCTIVGIFGPPERMSESSYAYPKYEKHDSSIIKYDLKDNYYDFQNVVKMHFSQNSSKSSKAQVKVDATLFKDQQLRIYDMTINDFYFQKKINFNFSRELTLFHDKLFYFDKAQISIHFPFNTVFDFLEITKIYINPSYVNIHQYMVILIEITLYYFTLKNIKKFKFNRTSYINTVHVFSLMSIIELLDFWILPFSSLKNRIITFTLQSLVFSAYESMRWLIILCYNNNATIFWIPIKKFILVFGRFVLIILKRVFTCSSLASNFFIFQPLNEIFIDWALKILEAFAVVVTLISLKKDQKYKKNQRRISIAQLFILLNSFVRIALIFFSDFYYLYPTNSCLLRMLLLGSNASVTLALVLEYS